MILQIDYKWERGNSTGNTRIWGRTKAKTKRGVLKACERIVRKDALWYGIEHAVIENVKFI